MDIANSVIVITAAGSSTGRAMAEHFCLLGAKVALIDTDQALLAQSLSICQQISEQCHSFHLSLYTVDNISTLFHQIAIRLGPMDVLVNYWQTTPLPTLLAPLEHQNVNLGNLATNLYLFGRCAAFNMLEHNKQGVIINIPSLNAESHPLAQIDCSNAVIKGLTQSWAVELERSNIRVGGVLPNVRRHRNGQVYPQAAINPEVLENVTYIVQNDSFSGRTLEAAYAHY